MTKEEFLKLLEKVESGTASLEEISAYNRFYNYFQTEQDWNSSEMGDQQELGRLMHEQISKAISKPGKIIDFRYFIKYAAAAVAVISVAMAVYFFNFKKQPVPVEQMSSLNTVKDVPAGGNKATLTLSNGTLVSLTDAKNGDLLKESGITVTKTADGQLTYQVNGESGGNAEADFNTISTPKGGQYQLLLSDGSKVWLNSASSLKFPTKFKGDVRNVELIGEAYFEISKNKNMPFNVVANGIKVVVLGTHFNVAAYSGEGGVKTTLVEGSVALNNGTVTTLLKPGQQGRATSAGSFEVTEADLKSALAWKNGYFMFNNADLPDVMRQLSRWYDVDVVFENKDKKYEFVGDIRRSNSLAKVLKILELSGIRFELKGRTLIVK
ncbi:FecR family protein [Pedobacter nyackensis]|uniref:FecR family protein n=1 Tax=Pedobacter nyackensis TaxID=475255 RepID=UPI00292D5A45|nr:FecR domain-containing protein [Pedobacter nyackensis]